MSAELIVRLGREIPGSQAKGVWLQTSLQSTRGSSSAPSSGPHIVAPTAPAYIPVAVDGGHFNLDQIATPSPSNDPITE